MSAAKPACIVGEEPVIYDFKVTLCIRTVVLYCGTRQKAARTHTKLFADQGSVRVAEQEKVGVFSPDRSSIGAIVVDDSRWIISGGRYRCSANDLCCMVSHNYVIHNIWSAQYSIHAVLFTREWTHPSHRSYQAGDKECREPVPLAQVVGEPPTSMADS